MKIVLQKDVEGLGREGAVVEVADGYARNFLLPKKLAVMATQGNLKQLEFKQKILAKREADLKAEAEKLATSLEGEIVELTAKAGEGERLYGSITPREIAEVLSEKKKIKLDKKAVVLESPIKSVGEHPAVVRLFPDVEAKITVKVKPQPGQKKEPKKVLKKEPALKEKAKAVEPDKEKEVKKEPEEAKEKQAEKESEKAERETKEEKKEAEEKVSGQTSPESK